MDQVATSAKRARKPRAKSKPADFTAQYVAMHETNAALCLASGFVAPRPEENAVKDHHVAAGRVVLDQHAPTASSLAGAAGDLPYGTVVLFDIDLRLLVPGHAIDLAAIPLAAVRRLVFADERSRMEFAARTSAYADIPEGLIPLEVNASLFEPGVETRAPLDALVDTEGLDKIVKADVGNGMSLLDRCSGAWAASLMTLREPGSFHLLSALAGIDGRFSDASSLAGIAWRVASQIDPASDAAAYKPLFVQIVLALATSNPADGFSASAFLKKLAMALGEQGDANRASQAQRFLRFAEDIVGLRRELPDASFDDLPGSSIPRGALLFLLNPEPDTLDAVRARTPGLGSRTYFVAAMLVGLRAGLVRLPASMKSDRDSFLALPQMVLAGFLGEPASLEVSSRWEPDGTRNLELCWEGRAVSRVAAQPDPGISSLINVADDVGLRLQHARHAEELSSSVVRNGFEGVVVLRQGRCPTFPRTPAIEVELAFESPLPKRNAGLLAVATNERARDTGVHGRLLEDGRRRTVALSAFMAGEPTTSSLLEALDALWVSAEEWANAAMHAPTMASAPAPGEPPNVA